MKLMKIKKDQRGCKGFGSSGRRRFPSKSPLAFDPAKNPSKSFKFLLITYDGNNKSISNDTLIFGSYFFLDDTRYEHRRDVQKFLHLISTFGGFGSAIYNTVSLVGFYVNQKLFMGYLITKLYKVKGKTNKA